MKIDAVIVGAAPGQSIKVGRIVFILVVNVSNRKGIKLRSDQWTIVKEAYETAYPLTNATDIKTGDIIPDEYEPRACTLIEFITETFADINYGYHICHKHRVAGIKTVKASCILCNPNGSKI